MKTIEDLVSEVGAADNGRDRTIALQSLRNRVDGMIRHEAARDEPRLLPIEGSRNAGTANESFGGSYSFRHRADGDVQVSVGAAILAQVPALGLARLTGMRLRNLVHEANSAAALLKALRDEARMREALVQVVEAHYGVRWAAHVGVHLSNAGNSWAPEEWFELHARTQKNTEAAIVAAEEG